MIWFISKASVYQEAEIAPMWLLMIVGMEQYCLLNT